MNSRFCLAVVVVVALVGLSGLDEVTCIPTHPEDPVCAAPEDCVGLAHISCAGDWTCFYGVCVWECALLTAEICDGYDNDGDGLVDEDLAIPEEPVCKTDGVCGNVQPQCGGESGWQCNYSQVLSYEVPEQSCDGLDNDCNGLTDDNLDWKESGACMALGVCASPDLQAVCNGDGGWDCFYTLVDDYEDTESSCDGLDNDCDGAIDLAVCGICESCTEDINCMTNACNPTPEGEKFCSSDVSHCVNVNSETGVCSVFSPGDKSCMSPGKPVLCIENGVWFGNLIPCEDPTPVCYDGECLACIPGAMRCECNIIQQCTDSSEWTDLSMCAEGYACVESGKCVKAAEFMVGKNVASGMMQASPVVATTGDGWVAVAWTSDSVAGGSLTDVVARFYAAALTPVGPAVRLNAYVSSNQRDPALASFPKTDGGFVAAWVADDQDGSGAGVFGAIFSKNGTRQVEDDIQFNTFTEGTQESPSVAAFYNGDFLVTWDSTALTGEGLDDDTRGIYMRLFKADGTPYWTVEKLVNSYTQNEQRWPTVANRQKQGYVVSWTSTGQDASSQGVIVNSLDNKADFLLGESVANIYEESSQKRSDAAGFVGARAGWYLLAWESFGQDTVANGVFMNIFNEDGEASVGFDISVNSGVVAGSQKDPSVAVLSDNSFGVVWETPNLDGDGDAVAARVFDEWGNAVNDEDEFQVNQTALGDQRNPDVAILNSCHFIVVWESVTNVPYNVDVLARVIRAP